MKTKKITGIGLKSFLALIVLAFAVQGCSDDFLKEKRRYDGGGWEVFNMEATLRQKIFKLYDLSLPGTGLGVGAAPSPSVGSSDIETQATLEYGGSSDWNNGDVSPMTWNNVVPAYLHSGKVNEGVYLRIRETNVIMDGIAQSTLSTTITDPVLGEAYFWRAWWHLYAFIYYGGIPVIDKAQNPIVADLENLKVNRSTSRETFQFISDDLDMAINLLPNKWADADYGRMTKYAAAALKGRLYLLWASPLFNRSDEASRWTDAYNVCLDAYNRCVNDGGRRLVEGVAADRGKKWAEMFTQWDSPEGVMVVLFNTSTDGQLKKNNGWENSARPRSQATPNNGGIVTTAEMVDYFPMKDGLRPGENYNPLKFFVDRDPRFYRTFAFPGATWPYAAVPTFTTWHYTWYNKEAEILDPLKTGTSGNYVSTPNSAIYVRKKTSSSARFDTSNNFSISSSPIFEIRMGEVVLNLAEAAAGANKLDDGFKYLRMIRERVYGADSPYASTDFGLSGVKGDRAKLLGAIVYERRVELAYEGKTFLDQRRWLLFDGGEEALGGKYANGNTLTYLGGFQPLNGIRRHGVQIVYPQVVGGVAQSYDPVFALRPAGLNPDAPNEATFQQQMADLSAFYDNFIRKNTDNLDNADGRVFRFLPYYYFLGLRKNAMEKGTYLWQTVGWYDMYNNPGLFDPLSDVLPEKDQYSHYQ